MHNIFFLSSFHHESGNCNSRELYDIIKMVKPNIIFEELDLDSYNDHYSEEGPYSIETIAIHRYIQSNNIKHMPVDTYDMNNIEKSAIEYMYNIFYEDVEYRRLLAIQLEKIQSYGYKFINSDECVKLIFEIQKTEDTIQARIGNNKLSKIYKNWIEMNNRREIEIIKNIYNYSMENAFETALLITGAEHRISLKKKLESHINENIKINWKYIQYDQNILNTNGT